MYELLQLWATIYAITVRLGNWDVGDCLKADTSRSLLFRHRKMSVYM